MNFIVKHYKDAEHFTKLTKDEQIEVLKTNLLSDDDIEKIFKEDNLELAVGKNNYDFDVNQIKVICCPNIFSRTDIKRNETKASTVLEGLISGNVIGTPYNTTNQSQNDDKERVLDFKNKELSKRGHLIMAVKNAVEENPRKPDFMKHFKLMQDAYPDIKLYKLYETPDKRPTCLAASVVGYIGAYYDSLKDVVNRTVDCTSLLCAHRDSFIGAVMTSVCIWMALHNFKDTEIYEHAQRVYALKESRYSYLFDRQRMYNIIHSAKNRFPERNNYSLNYASMVVPFSIKMFYETQTYRECMLELTKKYGDIGACCTIAGGLIAAYYNDTEVSFL